jgi:hypothetical protein
MDYAAEAADILPDFIENGQPIAIRRTTPGPFNPATGKYDVGTVKNFPGHALASGYHAKLIDGTRIKQGDQQFTVAASGLGVEPTVSDKLLDATGGVWGIVSCQAVAPGGVALLYRVQVRK